MHVLSLHTSLRCKSTNKSKFRITAGQFRPFESHPSAHKPETPVSHRGRRESRAVRLTARTYGGRNSWKFDRLATVRGYGIRIIRSHYSARRGWVENQKRSRILTAVNFFLYRKLLLTWFPADSSAFYHYSRLHCPEDSTSTCRRCSGNRSQLKYGK